METADAMSYGTVSDGLVGEIGVPSCPTLAGEGRDGDQMVLSLLAGELRGLELMQEAAARRRHRITER